MVNSLWSISVSEVCFGIAILLWVADCWTSREFRLKIPPFTPFLVTFFVAVLIAIAFSTDFLASVPYLKKFIKFLYIFLIFTYLNRERVEFALKTMFGVLGISAVYGILQYFWLREVNLLSRVEGFMSHWMTFSGQLMLVSVALAGYLLLYQLPPTSAGEEKKTPQEASERKKWSRREILPIGAWVCCWPFSFLYWF